MGHCFDTAVNLGPAFQGVSQEDAKTILLTFHGYAVSAVCFHHRRFNSHARVFLDSPARMDDERIVRPLQCRHCFIPIGRLRAGRNVAANGYVTSSGCEFHIVGCCNLAVRLQASVRFQRDVAFDVCSVTFCMKFRADLQHALGFTVFYRNIAVDYRLDREH